MVFLYSLQMCGGLNSHLNRVQLTFIVFIRSVTELYNLAMGYATQHNSVPVPSLDKLYGLRQQG